MKSAQTVVRHQCRAFGSRFSQIGDHGHRGVVPVPVRFNISRNQTPDGGVRVLAICAAIGLKWWRGIWRRFGLTPWEQIKIAVPNEVFRSFGILLPDRILLDLYGTSSVSLGRTSNG